MAIFLESNRRTAYVQAETFCSILILKKSDLDNIKVNYPEVAKDIIKEANKRAAETKEIEEAHVDDIWKDIKNPEEEKNNLERMYGTPPGYRKKNFSPKMFEMTSRRSSYSISGTNLDLISPKMPKLKKNESFNLDKYNPHESFEKIKRILPQHHNSNNNLMNPLEDFQVENRRKSQF